MRLARRSLDWAPSRGQARGVELRAAELRRPAALPSCAFAPRQAAFDRAPPLGLLAHLKSTGAAIAAPFRWLYSWLDIFGRALPPSCPVGAGQQKNSPRSRSASLRSQMFHRTDDRAENTQQLWTEVTACCHLRTADNDVAVLARRGRLSKTRVRRLIPRCRAEGRKRRRQAMSGAMVMPVAAREQTLRSQQCAGRLQPRLPRADDIVAVTALL